MNVRAVCAHTNISVSRSVLVLRGLTAIIAGLFASVICELYVSWLYTVMHMSYHPNNSNTKPVTVGISMHTAALHVMVFTKPTCNHLQIGYDERADQLSVARQLWCMPACGAHHAAITIVWCAFVCTYHNYTMRP